MRVWLLRIACMLALAITSTVAALPAAAHPTVEVSNPSPNDRLTPGALVMSGVAYDHDASQGSGVDRVLVFVGSRDHGGQFLGEARLGMPSTMAISPLQFTLASWTLRTQTIRGAGEQRTLFVYAHSSVTDTETLIKVPLIVGHQPPPPPGPVVIQNSGSMGPPALADEDAAPEE